LGILLEPHQGLDFGPKNLKGKWGVIHSGATGSTLPGIPGNFSGLQEPGFWEGQQLEFCVFGKAWLGNTLWSFKQIKGFYGGISLPFKKPPLLVEDLL